MTPVGTYISVNPLPMETTLRSEPPMFHKGKVNSISQDISVPYSAGSEVYYAASRKISLPNGVFVSDDNVTLFKNTI